MSLETELEARQWGVVVRSMVAVTIASSMVQAVSYALMGAPADAKICLATIVGAVLVFAVLTARKNVQEAQVLAICFYVAEFAIAAVATGVTTYLSWVGVLMLFGFFIGGPVKGLRWTIGLAGVLIAAGLVMVIWPVSPTPVSNVVQLVRVLCLAPVLGAWGYFYEVARVRNAAELEAARAAAQQASDAKGRLLAKVSHEIRTPLNGVLGLTQALLLQPLPGPVMGDLRLIQQSGTGLLVLINDLLDIARAEAGKIELHPTPVELGQLLTDLAALHRSSAQLKRLDLRVEWKTDAPCWVRADELRLRQIIGNLVSNAIKFTQSGEVVLRLGVGPETAGLTQTTFSIQDSGVGLDSQAIPQLFQPFRQFHTATGGSGLGLAISQELAKCMGGRLTVTSEQGTGSIFSLHLPLARATPPTSTIDTPERLDPFHALVVDDNQINRRVAQAFVTLLGGFSVGAVDGVEALRLAAGGSFDLILMDLQMPNLDGLQATARLREVGLIMPVLGLTAAVGPETLPACLKAGMVNCLSKPLDLSTLRAELRRHLGGRLQWPEDGPAAPRVRDAAAHGRISKVEEEGFTEEGDAPDRGAGHHRGCDRHCARKAVRRRKLRHVRGAREG